MEHYALLWNVCMNKRVINDISSQPAIIGVRMAYFFKHLVTPNPGSSQLESKLLRQMPRPDRDSLGGSCVLSRALSPSHTRMSPTPVAALILSTLLVHQQP